MLAWYVKRLEFYVYSNDYSTNDNQKNPWRLKRNFFISNNHNAIYFGAWKKNFLKNMGQKISSRRFLSLW